ncbi:MAG: radical SAM protein [Nitrospirae bacterium]|nr:radical SAM protein [Nitrospirota bacterium]
MAYKDSEIDKIQRKSLLYRTGVEYGDYCLNHVEGCAHGCLYPCYAMMMKRRTGAVKTYEEWRKPKLVGNALELLDREIPRHRHKIKSVHLCFSTDPFMFGHDEVTNLSLKIIKKLNKESIPCTTLTKGLYPSDSIDYDFSSDNRYGITLVSLNESFRNDYEPFTARVKERIESLRLLHEKNFKTWVSIEPYPTPNIITQDLSTILDAVSFVDEIVFGRLNYNSKVRAFPHFVEFYNSQAKTVMSFCKTHRIKCHIKEGTIV